MAAPTIRGQTAAVAGLSATSPSGTAVDDLVVVYTFERLGAGSGSTLTTDTGSGYVEIRNFFHNDGATDGTLAVAYKVATQSGAQSYQAFTSSVGTDTWTGLLVLQTSTYDVGSLPPSNASTQTNNAVPNPPQVTGLNSATDYLVAAISAWHLGSSATVTPTAPSTYTNLVHISGSATAELACASKAISGATSEDPAAYGDDVAPNGTCSITVAFAGVPAFLTISVNDTDGPAEQVALSLVRRPVVNDTVTVAESVSLRSILSVAVNDADAATEIVRVNEILPVSVTEIVSANESVSLRTVVPVSVDDVLGAVEHVSVVVNPLTVTVSDLTSTTESATVAIAMRINASDLEPASELATAVVNPLAIALSESVITAEAVTVVVPFLGLLTLAVADTAVTIESASLVVQPLIVLADDAAPAAESLGAALPTRIAVSDTAMVDESAAITLNPLVVLVSESASAGEEAVLAESGALSVHAADTSTASESVLLIAPAIITVSDALAGLEVVTVALPMAAMVSDDTTETEHATAGLVLGVVVADIDLLEEHAEATNFGDLQILVSETRAVTERILAGRKTRGAVLVRQRAGRMRTSMMTGQPTTTP